MQTVSIPRVVVAGLAGDAGKTLVSLGLALAARRAGVAVRAFKKGPDYIDTAWLAWASGHTARNLDTYLMGFDGAAASFAAHGCVNGLNVIEGNRGVFDGTDVRGTHSTAELAKAIDAPVLLVINATKATRTVAACVLGCQRLDPDVRFAGVILNEVGTARQERILRESIEQICGIPVLGSVPRLRTCLMPGRHLGLVTPGDHPSAGALGEQLLTGVGDCLDLEGILACARSANMMVRDNVMGAGTKPRNLTVGYIKDRVFTFYYPENLEALEAAGAKLAPIDSLTAQDLPGELDALYIGGGFPETHVDALSGNAPFLRALNDGAARGLPIYAECGGLMLLSRAIRSGGRSHPMSGVLPFEVEMCPSPQGHGYVRLKVDRPNPFYPVGLEIKGHEFHYSRVVAGCDPPPTACSVERGAGCFKGRDGALAGNVWASYTHIHALGVPAWADGVAKAAAAYSASRRALV